MSDIITLEEAASRIEASAGGTEIFPFSFSDIKSRSKDYLEISGQSYGLGKQAQKQFAEFISVPFPYVSRSPNELVALNYNYLIDETPNRTLNAMVKDNDIYAFSEADIPHVNHVDVLNATVEAVGEGSYIKNFSFDGNGLMNAVVTRDDLNYDDHDTPYFGGVKVRFSDSWSVHPLVEGYLERQWCTNGATSQIEKRKFRVKGHSSDAIIEQFAEFAAIAKDQVGPMFEGFIHLRNEAVGNVREVILRICQENKIPTKVFNRIMEYWGTDGFKSTFPRPEDLINKPTMYHVINLFTYVGTHCTDISSDHKELLRAIGGSSALSHHDRCNSCGGLV
ncbi:hypothetical protein CL620_04925 [archaeon]|jgi:hypothetical protein|nr:hypothetical protein [archaeon]|tara:strand:- start:463 stop:1470 length:1008 start_codon:yes stop_codon:yes gene_type:complete